MCAPVIFVFLSSYLFTVGPPILCAVDVHGSARQTVMSADTFFHLEQSEHSPGAYKIVREWVDELKHKNECDACVVVVQFL